MNTRTYLAVDIGAESGRLIAGNFDGKFLRMRELHRFSNAGVWLGEHLHWDILQLWNEIKRGLALAAQEFGEAVCSLGLDTWGVDFGLLAADDTLIGIPYHYRDHRTDGIMQVAFSRVPKSEIFNQTGNQFIQLNSLYQLLSMAAVNSPALSIAQTFLNMPDLFNFYLTGCKVNEFTISSTTQCYDIRTREWAFDLLAQLGIPTKIFGEVVPPGTILGKLRPSLREELGLNSASVIASAGHDTASAVAAVPASSPDYIYLSSGTWSLLGVEIAQPDISQGSLAACMTNEGGVGDKIRFLKNIIGLWFVQECRRDWKRQGSQYTYDELTQMASKANPFGPLIIPDDSRFSAPCYMPDAIQSFCTDTGQSIPQDRGAIVRCILESLALEYRWVSEQIEKLRGVYYPLIHIIGGGTKNKLLNQLIADATGKTIIAGPVEATALGNIIVQAIAMGDIASLAEGRAIVRDSFELQTYIPSKLIAWDDAFERYLELKVRE
ncbi:rhamnulokinase family protein [Chloroflexota bacterium]